LVRVFHSLKGISAMVELRPAETLAHDLESYLRTLRERGAVLSADGIDVLFQGTQRLDEIIAAHRAGRPQHDLGDIVGRIEQLLAADPSASPRRATHTDPTAASSRPRWRCSFAPTREMLARGIGVDAIRKRLAAIGTIVQATPHVGPDGDIRFDFELLSDAGAAAFADLRADGVIVTEVEEPRNPMLPESSTDAAARADAPAMASHVVRVDLKRLDDLMQNVGDLVISRARLGESLARLEPHVPPLAWRAVQDNTIAIDRQLRTLRENLMRVRLVPVGEIFRRMPFVVRDLARDTGKRVRLELRGQSTEIDKFVVERMMDPVLHLVRNAVSHGIELPDERIRAGKPPDATLTLSASTAGEFVRMEIADDGRGIDAERVLARAAAHGLAVPAGTPQHR
jgi:two-component system chemotaxis sensor kinase CheA